MLRGKKRVTPGVEHSCPNLQIEPGNLGFLEFPNLLHIMRVWYDVTYSSFDIQIFGNSMRCTPVKVKAPII
jgi:hypothetical protein